MEYAALDRIELIDLRAQGIVGVYSEERTRRREIVMHVTLWIDARAAAVSDSLRDTVDYATVAQTIVQRVEGIAPQLIERLAGEVVDTCLRFDARIQSVEVRVEKPGAVPEARSVAITVRRNRDWAKR